MQSSQSQKIRGAKLRYTEERERD
jgi:peptidoglycan hydrolase CwlO-like protein